MSDSIEVAFTHQHILGKETNSHSLLIKSNSLTAQTVTLSLLLCAAGFSGNINTVLCMIGL